jgi:hypothetical protein
MTSHSAANLSNRSDALIGGPRALSDIRSTATPVPLKGSSRIEEILTSPAGLRRKPGAPNWRGFLSHPPLLVSSHVTMCCELFSGVRTCASPRQSDARSSPRSWKSKATTVIAEAVLFDAVSPAICMSEDCDFTCEMEPDQDAGFCEECRTKSMISSSPASSNSRASPRYLLGPFILLNFQLQAPAPTRRFA